MTIELKWYQKLLIFVIFLICAIFFITYSRTAIATLTDRPGFYGNLHNYYGVKRISFGIYNLFVGIATLTIISLQLSGLIKNKKHLIKYGNWIFLGLALLLIVGELYLQSSFQGKG